MDGSKIIFFLIPPSRSVSADEKIWFNSPGLPRALTVPSRSRFGEARSYSAEALPRKLGFRASASAVGVSPKL